MYIYQIMSNSFGYLDIILLGMIAGFIILRLRSILGRKTGHESKVYPNFAEKKFSMPKQDAEPIIKNHEVLEGKEKKEFLKQVREDLKNDKKLDNRCLSLPDTKEPVCVVNQKGKDTLSKCFSNFEL